MMVFMNVFIAMLGIAVVGLAGLAIAKVGGDQESADVAGPGREPSRPESGRRVS